MKKTGRNDPCPCGSGKKFKKCCETTMIGGRYKAAKVDISSAPKIASASRLTGLFKTQLAGMPLVAEKAPLQATIRHEEPIQPISSDAQEVFSSSSGVEQKVDI